MRYWAVWVGLAGLLCGWWISKERHAAPRAAELEQQQPAAPLDSLSLTEALHELEGELDSMEQARQRLQHQLEIMRQHMWRQMPDTLPP